VKGKPISKDIKSHIIEGLGVSEKSPGNYELSVMAQDLSHAIPILNKPLSEWLEDNQEAY